MGNLQKIQTDFGWGEISPQMLARIDLAQYHKATKTMVNAFPLTTGGCTRRAGTRYLAEVYNSNQKARLIPFEYSTDNSYMLVFNGGKIEFLKNGVFIKNGQYNYQLNHTYAESELAEITYTQIGNSMFLAHQNHPPRQLQKITDTSWTLTDIVFTCRATTDVSYENAYISFKILGGATKFVVGDKFTFSNYSGTITNVVKTGTGNGDLAQPTAMPGAPDESWTVQCVYTDSTRQLWSVVGSIHTSPVLTWRAGSYPAAIGFSDQRLWLGGTREFPQTLWATKIGSYFDLTLGSADSDALSFTMSGDNNDQLKHLPVARRLLPMTAAGEYSIAGGVNGTITPSVAKIQSQTRHGSSNVRPVQIGGEVVFVERSGKKLRAISYSVTEDANVAKDITLFADHVVSSGIKDMCFAQDPHYVAWLTRNDGIALTLTLDRTYADVIGWARHITQGKFENTASIKNYDSTDVYFIVQRTINGVSKRFIERLDYDDNWTDASLTVALPVGTKGTTFTGLSHLEGMTVDITADGAFHPTRVVTGGTITLEYPANTVRVGLHYDTVIEILHPEFADPNSTVQGRRLSVYEAIFRFKDTINCKVNGYQVPFRTTAVGLDHVIEPFTGDKKVGVIGWRSPMALKIEQVTPMPFTLLGVIMKVAINE